LLFNKRLNAPTILRHLVGKRVFCLYGIFKNYLFGESQNALVFGAGLLNRFSYSPESETRTRKGERWDEKSSVLGLPAFSVVWHTGHSLSITNYKEFYGVTA